MEGNQEERKSVNERKEGKDEESMVISRKVRVRKIKDKKGSIKIFVCRKIETERERERERMNKNEKW